MIILAFELHKIIVLFFGHLYCEDQLGKIFK